MASSFSIYGTFILGTLGVKTKDTPSYTVTNVTLNFDELVNMSRTTVYAELYCYGLLIKSGDWTGVRLGLVLEKAGVSVYLQLGSVEFYAIDGYSTNLDLLAAARSDIIIAYEKDGLPLVETTRLVIPYANGDKWISNINQIKIVIPSNNTEISVIIE